MTTALSPVLAILIPLTGALLISIFHARPNQREAVTLITAVLLLFLLAT